MNAVDSYLVNCNSNDYAEWQPARWERAGDIPRFHWMTLDKVGGMPVLLHDSCIKRVTTDAKPAEEAMCHLLEHYQLVPEARKLITAALQAQASGQKDFTI